MIGFEFGGLPYAAVVSTADDYDAASLCAPMRTSDTNKLPSTLPSVIRPVVQRPHVRSENLDTCKPNDFPEEVS